MKLFKTYSEKEVKRIMPTIENQQSRTRNGKTNRS